MAERTIGLSRRTVLGGIGAVGVVGAGAMLTSRPAAASTSLSIDDPADVTTDDGEIKWLAVTAFLRTEWDGFDEDVHYARYTDVVTIRPNSTDNTYVIHDTFSDDLADGGEPAGPDDHDGWGGDTGWHGGEHYSGAGTTGYIHADIDWGICQKDRQHLYNDGYALPDDPAPVANLEADVDGETRSSLVRLRKRVRLYGAGTDADGVPNNPLTGPRSPFGVADPAGVAELVVDVTNEEATATSTGRGTSSVGT